MDKLLTVRHAADLLSIHPKTLYEWIREGRIQKVDLFGSVRLRESDIRRIMEGTKCEGESLPA
jgi:excisionase family DNA binding protein